MGVKCLSFIKTVRSVCSTFKGKFHVQVGLLEGDRKMRSCQKYLVKIVPVFRSPSHEHLLYFKSRLSDASIPESVDTKQVHTRDLVGVILTNLKTDSRVLFILEHSKTFQTDLWNTSLNGISYPMSLIENERL